LPFLILVFLITATFPLLIVISSFLLDENKIGDDKKELEIENITNANKDNEANEANEANKEKEKNEENNIASSTKLNINNNTKDIDNIKDKPLKRSKIIDENINIIDKKRISNKDDEKKGNEINNENNNDNIYTTTTTDENKFSNNLSNNIFQLWLFLKKEEVYKPVIYVFLYMLTPSYSGPLFYFYTNVLKFTPMIMGRLKLIYGFAAVIGLLIYNKFLHKNAYKDIIWATSLMSLFFNLLTIIVVMRLNVKIGIPDFWFCMTADSLTTALAEINTLPLIVLTCNICPKNLEGTLIAFIMSIINLGSLISNQLGGYLCFYLGN